MTLAEIELAIARLQSTRAARIEWQTVTSASPVRLRPDDADAELDMDVASLVPVQVGQRAAVWIAGSARLVLGPHLTQSGTVTMTLAATATNEVWVPLTGFSTPPRTFVQMADGGNGLDWQSIRCVVATAPQATGLHIIVISTGTLPAAGSTLTLAWLATA